MNVIVSNKANNLLSSLQIDVIKKIQGEFSVEEIISIFENFFYQRMILDITAIKDYANISNILCVSKARLEDYITTLSKTEMKQIDVAIAVSLDLMNYYAKLKNNLEDKIEYIQKIKNERNLAQDQVRENPKYQELENQSMEVWKFEKYLTNSKGERFDFSEGPRANGEAGIVDGIMTSTCMFDLTPNDATDEVTLHLEYNGNQADIVLKRVR